MILELTVGVSDDPVALYPRREHQDCVHVLLAAIRDADDRGIAHAWQFVQHPLDVLGEHVEPLGRHDHFLLAALDENAPLVVTLSYIAGMEPAVTVEHGGIRDRGSGIGLGFGAWDLGCRICLVISARHVLAAHENLAVVCNAHFDAFDRCADRSLACLERVIERDDRRGFREAIALNNGEADAPPELLEVRRQRCRANDKGPELQAERRVDAPVPPPPAWNRDARGRRLARFRPRTRRMVAQDVENLRHADEDRNSPRLDQPLDVVRVETAGEDDGPAHHRGNVGGHRLPEHMAEGQKIEKSQRVKRTRVLPVFQNLALDGNDVREHIAVADDDTLWLGCGAGREDDLDDVVARDRDLRHRAVAAPVDVRHLPDVGAGKLTAFDVVSGQHDTRVDQTTHFRDEVAR